jgi:hypothetical protein
MEANQMQRRWTFRLRTGMVLVLLIALTCFGGLVLRRRHHYLKEAELHASQAEQHANHWRFWFEEAGSGRVRELNPPDHSALSDYHKGLADKYQQAAQRPWREIEPDPPAPRGAIVSGIPLRIAI